MDIRHLTYFIEVAHHRSFTKAAQALHITQPSISKMIKLLEDELDVTLFYRSAKQIELTDAGKALLYQSQQIVNSFQNLTSDLADVINSKKGAITIGLPPMVGARFFPQIISDFTTLHPQISLTLLEVGSQKVQVGIDDGSLDIGVVMLPIDEDIFEMFPIVNEPMMLIVHPEHTLAEKAIVDLSQLKDENFILFRKSFTLHDNIINRCIESGFTPNIIFKSSHWDFIAEMVAINFGIALLPRIICKDLDPERIKIIPIAEPMIHWNLGVIWKKDRYLSFAAKEFINFTSKRFDTNLKI
ncbi:MAG: transcriptional regulator, LysR family [Firmicutes bacterium]|nr:transcriptional regulator, LysR family [Bacillota bacterium]